MSLEVSTLPGGNTPSNDLLTASETAAITGLTEATLAQYRSYRNRGRILGPDFVRVGGRQVRYRRADVESYIEQAFQIKEG